MIWNPWKNAAIARQEVDAYRSELLASYKEVDYLYKEVDYLEEVLGKIVDKSVGYVNPTIVGMANMAQEALSRDY